ncbi:hypothetical protein [Lebetimonas sp. JH292]|uniref:hypothetical protein n=1 Tax=Lebetimonas sp. JH292 TaxID=990068 RepID=UPI0004B83CFA|nr:hypothetical protein [Lebetimonas sp. JH292]
MPDDFSLEKCKNCKALNSYKHMKLLYEISNLLNSYEDIGKSIEKSLNLLKNEQYFERGALFVYEEENNCLSLFASVGLTSQQKKLAIYKLGEGATLGTRNTSIISYVAVPIIKPIFGSLSIRIQV